MKNIRDLYSREEHPLKVLQIGEGNFLRAFVDYGIDVANEENGFDAGVAIVMPRAKKSNERFAKQDNLYTVLLRGQKDGKPYKENRVVKCIEKVIGAYTDYDEFMELAKVPTLEYVVSNTTEAGIVYDAVDKYDDCPPATFPAKLTKFLFTRYEHFHAAADKGLVMLPVELIDHNGEALKKCVLQYADLWKLEPGFSAWINHDCVFASTLVDRIVAGYPKDQAADYEKEIGYTDCLLDQGEPFGLWVIGAPELKDKLPLDSSRLHVEFTDNIEKFKEQKVRILNGAHTSMVLGAYLAGFDYVGQCMKDPAVRKQLDQSVYGEIVPTVHLPEEKSKAFADAVFERFENPFVNHALLSISLNSLSKWRARVLPTFKDSLKNTGKLPKWLTYSFAALLAFYHTTEHGDGCLVAKRAAGNTYEIHDDQDKLDKIAEWAALDDKTYARNVMSQTDWWGEDLTAIPGFEDAVDRHFARIQEVGAKAHIEELGKED